ncbi:hypothetical protein [Glycomyces albidus]|uniref:Uncharacterized protein n=1 Tax=Glycomyces albidus TaxID=2656774 RepID=A0A6L5G6L8_9ACTN|nr:hypothetical protein [Glycomyces albidus]MQM25272.1 hypothetical protein [Glycomyces albidus]
MSDRDPMASIFVEYTDDTTAEVKERSTDPLWRKARRRRIGRTAAAAAAALALVAPASWLLAGAAGSDGQVEESAQEQSFEIVEGGPDDGGVTLVFGQVELVGATIDLPSFAPGNAGVDRVCTVDGAVVADGRLEAPEATGTVFLKQFVQLPVIDEDDETQALFSPQVALFGCDTGDETLFQAVVVEQVDGEWTATQEAVRSEPGGESPQYLSSDADGDLLVVFAERFDPGADDVAHWVERVVLDSDEAPVREPVGDLEADGYADLAVDAAVTETDEADVWTIAVTVRNTGPWVVSDQIVAAGRNEGVEVLSGAPVVVPAGEDLSAVEEIDGLAVGQSRTLEWTVAVDADALPESELSPLFVVQVQSAAPWQEAPELVRELDWYSSGVMIQWDGESETVEYIG